MEISKILVVHSPVHFWNLIKNRDEIFESVLDLIMFIDTVDLYINGCECDKNTNYNLMVSQYNSIKNNTEMINHLVKCFECDKIRFQ
jgi:hypothetical protein